MSDTPLGLFPQTFPYPAAGPVPRAMATAIAGVLVGGVRRRFQQGVDGLGRPWPRLAHERPRGGAKPLVDTGVLRDSYTMRVEADGASVGSVLPQARLHNFGGTVRPRRTKYLAIPVTAEARRYGSPRRFPRRLFFRKTRRGGAMCERVHDVTVTHYVLVTEVVIPAREHLTPSADDLRAIDEVCGHFGYLMASGQVTRG